MQEEAQRTLLGQENNSFEVYAISIEGKGKRKKYTQIKRKCILLKEDHTICGKEFSKQRDAINHIKLHQYKWKGKKNSR